MNRPERSVYSATDFQEWRENQTLVLTPKFQRRGVWKPAARSFFIDTLIREMPIPPIYIRLTQAVDRTRIVREVIDGQQRVAAVLDFINGDYRLSRTLEAKWAGKTFDKLTPAQQKLIKTYSFPSEVFQGISDLEVLEVFSRLNTYSVPLNSQELRNGRFFGSFKQCAYSLAREQLEFWRRHRVFSERNIARMLEVEFVSEIMIALLDGMQDKKKSIDSFYEDYDEEFKARARVEKRFREATDRINDVFPEGLGETEFRRPPLLYTLYCVVIHRLFDLRGVKLPTPRKTLSREHQTRLRERAQFLSEKIEQARAHEPIPPSYTEFVAACLTQTDNIKPRETRLRTLYRATFARS